MDPAVRRSFTIAGTTLVAAAVLLLPAAWNGFPLVFPDTGAYLSVTYGFEWTADRSPYYGLFLKPAAWVDAHAGLWLMLFVQAAIIASLVIAACRRLLPDSSPLAWLALVALTAALTSLPWHAAQLMPDAFSGVLVLAVWIAATRDPTETGTPLLWLLCTGLVLMHMTHFGLLLAALAGTLAGLALAGTKLRRLWPRLLAGLLALAAAATIQTSHYGMFFSRWSVSPMGPVFLFARLNEDGLVPRWFDRHCGLDGPRPLCAARGSLPRDSQQLLWDRQRSPVLGWIGSGADPRRRWQWVGMMREAAFGSIREEPGAFLAASARHAAQQFVRFKALDDECPDVCRDPRSALISRVGHYRPELLPTLLRSAELRGEIPRKAIRSLTTPVAVLALLLLGPMAWLAWRRRDAAALSLLFAVVASLIANAAMAGAFSDVHDRYQSRVVWLAPFCVLLIIVRWWRRCDAASMREVRKREKGAIPALKSDANGGGGHDRHSR